MSPSISHYEAARSTVIAVSHDAATDQYIIQVKCSFCAPPFAYTFFIFTAMAIHIPSIFSMLQVYLAWSIQSGLSERYEDSSSLDIMVSAHESTVYTYWFESLHD